MPRRLRNVLSIIAAALTSLAGTAQQAANQKQPWPRRAAAGRQWRGWHSRGDSDPGQNDMLATVVDGTLTETVTRAVWVCNYRLKNDPEDEDRQAIYDGAMERLLNTKLLMMFLARQQIPVAGEDRRDG